MTSSAFLQDQPRPRRPGHPTSLVRVSLTFTERLLFALVGAPAAYWESFPWATPERRSTLVLREHPSTRVPPGPECPSPRQDEEPERARSCDLGAQEGRVGGEEKEGLCPMFCGEPNVDGSTTICARLLSR